MEIKELFGRTITNVFGVFGVHEGWLDTADCIIELDKNLLIGIPFVDDQEVWVRDLPENSERLFGESSYIVLGRKIVDFIWYEDSFDSCYFLLDDGTIITENRMSPQGAGQAGLHMYDSLKDLEDKQGAGFKRLTIS